ncbi:DNA mismatch repair protein MutS [Synechococcus sp. RS9909]|uniref:DNA mismatch repair protein MutS n=1 Tax=unclassified Synechococcus TaxID=2626047 RepID=UPI00006906D0|nr:MULTISPECIES: DNA mismatch repair protein MutS [unclassified Synechococcus]EAQ70249.1 DNA mismatch repair protein MutS [Synechococcus sp. RS9917]QNI78096.1 DNA mismatch repair protein MutS [Synechococcus sp. RS9909]
MPRSAAQPPEQALQGNLFGAPEPAADPQPQRSRSDQDAAATADLSDASLSADARQRPRQRREQEAEATPASDHGNEAADAHDDGSDAPAWAHHSQVDPLQLTPMLRHYVELKAAHPERVLLYRLGDFFECFFEDAIELARVLELTLTGKEGGKAIGRVPMAGIPHHAAERYCADLIRRGYSVALCDQLETTPAKGALLKRDITRVLTPGTVLEEGMLRARRNNWLAAVVVEAAKGTQPFRWGLAHADVSTGDVRVIEQTGSAGLHQQLSQLEAAELVWAAPPEESAAPAWCPQGLRLTPMATTPFSRPEAEATLQQHYGLANLDGLGLADQPLALRAIGGLLRYLRDTQPLEDDLNVPLEVPQIVHSGDALILDAQTRRNLELTSTQRDGQLQGSLLWAIDRTLTAMGGRCLRRWLEAPLMDRRQIEQRQALVSTLVEQRSLRQGLRRLLRSMADLERLAGRAGAGHAGARDLVAIADGLERLPQLAGRLNTGLDDRHPDWLQALCTPDPALAELAQAVRHALIDTPPLSLSEGGLIHDGVDPLLDGLRNQLDDQEAWLAEQERLERQTSGNANLRLQYHRTFGYFLAVSKAKAASVPDHWIRRQTLANEERFITPELKQREGTIFQLRARACQREYELFCQLREQVGAMAAPIRQAARAVAALDAVCGLAEVAATSAWCAPTISDGRELQITAGRHPVVEQLLVERSFTANDVHLGQGTDLVVLTGPNASGKSCYLRQIGLIQLLAQIGSWVPAESATVGITDRIFTRVGAVDDLAAGQSTFMVEMAETANILHHATDRSLVLLDEIGRGTATFDGLSIAWAVSEHLAGDLKARTVFATHYHELNNLAAERPNVANFQVLVEETGDDLLFLHRVQAGGASRSYGIEAARLAGVPAPVVQRARQVLDQLAA